MYNRTAKSITAREGGRGVLFNKNVKPGMSELGKVQHFLVYSTPGAFLTIKLVPGNVVMIGFDIYEKSPITGEWIYGIT